MGPVPHASPKAAKVIAVPLAKPPPAPEVMRVISWEGDWVCPCGKRHRMRDPCESCKQQEPCRSVSGGMAVVKVGGRRLDR